MKSCGDLTFNRTSGKILLVHHVHFDSFLVQVHLGSFLPPGWQTVLGFHARLEGGRSLLRVRIQSPWGCHNAAPCEGLLLPRVPQVGHCPPAAYINLPDVPFLVLGDLFLHFCPCHVASPLYTASLLFLWKIHVLLSMIRKSVSYQIIYHMRWKICVCVCLPN